MVRFILVAVALAATPVVDAHADPLIITEDTVLDYAVDGHISLEHGTLTTLDGASADFISINSDSQITILGGTFGWIGQADSAAATLDIYGGVIGSLFMDEPGPMTGSIYGGEITGRITVWGLNGQGSRLDIHGGFIGPEHIFTFGGGRTHVYGFNLIHEGGPCPPSTPCASISGYLEDGAPFFTLTNDPSRFVLHSEPMDVPTPGDTFPFDGVVDVTDLNVVRNGFGRPGYGDMDISGRVDIADLNAVRNNFGLTAASVPEPSSVCLAAVSACLILGVTRSFSQRRYRLPLLGQRRQENYSS